MLTPVESPRPKINGASELGARAGSPIYYSIAATGTAPLELAAAGLPQGRTLDASGVVSGTVTESGVYRITL